MTLSTNAISPGFTIAEENLILLVPSGITTAIGGVYALDTTVITSTGRLTTIAAVSTGALKGLEQTLFVAQEVVVGATGGVACKFKYSSSLTKILVEGATDVVAGDYLKPVTATNHLVKAATADDVGVAIALAGQTSATPTLVDCVLLGEHRVTVD